MCQRIVQHRHRQLCGPTQLYPIKSLTQFQDLAHRLQPTNLIPPHPRHFLYQSTCNNIFRTNIWCPSSLSKCMCVCLIGFCRFTGIVAVQKESGRLMNLQIPFGYFPVYGVCHMEKWVPGRGVVVDYVHNLNFILSCLSCE